MFRSSIIIRELVLNLAKVIFMLKHSVELHRHLLCGCVAACHGMVFVVCLENAQHATHNTHAATQPHNTPRNSTECFNINITLARFSASSLMMVEDRNI